MYFTFACPHCNKKLKVRREAAGRKAGCPYCKASVVVPQPPEETGPTEPDLQESLRGIGSSQLSDRVSTKPVEKKAAPAKQKSSGAGESDRTDIGIIKSGLLGLVISTSFLLLLLPLINFPLGELFFKRGWVPFVLVFLMGWALAILVLKGQKLKRQRASMLFDLLPNDLGDDITAESLDKFVKHIHELPVDPSESFLIARVLRGLEHFRVRKSNPEVASMLASHSEIDANAVQSSYTLLNVFIWAIPILGFIGTVIGISAAVGAFSGSLGAASELSELTESLNNVTGGLATAFDTTLIALVMSIFVMFPTSSLQKAEEDLLNWVDEYCNENLLKRLNDGGDLSSAGDTTKIRQAFDSALAPHHAELRSWNEKLESIGKSLTDEVVRGWTDINTRIENRQTETVEQMKDLDAMAASFLRMMTKLSEQTEGVHRQAAGAMSESAKSLQGYCGALEQGLSRLNNVLTQLGEKQVRVEGRPRRRWFFGRGS